MKNIVTQELLKELFTYEPDTGNFYWNETGQGRNAVGVPAGCLSDQGYILISYRGMRHARAHRLAWLYVYGVHPSGYIDHINGNRADNRIANLREVTKAGNQQNVKAPRRHNSSGYLGVVSNKRRTRWISQITKNGKAIYLGSFATPQEAHERYLQEKRQAHPTNTL